MSLPSPQVASKLKELNFYSKKWMNDSQAEQLAKILEENQSITFVGFRECRQIGDKGASIIAKTLQTNHTLKKISLESTGVGNQGAIEFARSLSLPNCYLHRLDLSYCNIGDKGACSLAHAIACDSSRLGILMIEHCNKVSDMSGKSFIKALQVNRSLTMLSLKGTSISADIRSTIEKMLRIRDPKKRGSFISNKEPLVIGNDVVHSANETQSVDDSCSPHQDVSLGTTNPSLQHVKRQQPNKMMPQKEEKVSHLGKSGSFESSHRVQQQRQLLPTTGNINTENMKDDTLTQMRNEMKQSDLSIRSCKYRGASQSEQYNTLNHPTHRAESRIPTYTSQTTLSKYRHPAASSLNGQEEKCSSTQPPHQKYQQSQSSTSSSRLPTRNLASLKGALRNRDQRPQSEKT